MGDVEKKKPLHVRKLLRHDQPVVTDQCTTSRSNTLLAIRSKRDVSVARMAAIERPFCLAMADDEASRSRHVIVP